MVERIQQYKMDFGEIVNMQSIYKNVIIMIFAFPIYKMDPFYKEIIYVQMEK